MTEHPMALTIEEKRMKDLLKQALVEIFSEEQELFSELVSDALEDVALTRAIQEGEKTELVSRDEVFSLLGTAE